VAAEKTVIQRLRWYWQMEASCAVAIPLAAHLLARPSGLETAPSFWVAAFACAALLAVGGLYWRAVLKRMEGAPAAFETLIPRLAMAGPFLLAMVTASAAALALDVALFGEGWTGGRIAAAVLTLLAALEYVNYYVVQLQHFDNPADFKRLIAGRGFRKAHLARDIAAWRTKQRRQGSPAAS